VTDSAVQSSAASQCFVVVVVTSVGLRPSGAARHNHFGDPLVVFDIICRKYFIRIKENTNIILTNSPF
jgi:hypothetical protein